MTVLPTLSSESIDLIYIDPPFNTHKTQTRLSETSYMLSYEDSFVDYLSFLRPRLLEAFRLLSMTGSIFIHLDYREVHYVKVEMDKIFGRNQFINEIIWAYDYGGRSKSRWSAKHDTILWYIKGDTYCFNYDLIDRIPYLAPALVGAEKATRGKTPTDVWWNTIVPTMGYEKTGYPTQKPLTILNRIVQVHSNPTDQLLDFFAGSGSFGEAAAINNRNCILIDFNIDAIQIMKQRLKKYGIVCPNEV